MKITLIFAIIAVVAIVLSRWYAKIRYYKTKEDELSNYRNRSHPFSCGYLNTPETKRLKRSAAAELGISAEELDRMSADDFKQLVKERKLINPG
jgi:hypothetical protein